MQRVRRSVEIERSRLVVIDSLNAHLQAMPGDKFLVLQMHELLNYLNQKSIITLLILGQHGLVGEVRSDLDLLHSQKLEAVGQLTNGIAHDFNNLLTAIVGNADLIQRRRDNARH